MSALDHLGAALFAWVPAMTLATALVLAGALLVDWATHRRVSAGARALLYLAVVARLALPTDLASPVGLLGSTVRVSDPRAPDEGSAAHSALPAAVRSPERTPGAAASAPESAVSGTTERRQWPEPVAGAGYVVVSLILLGAWLALHMRLRRQLRSARRRDDLAPNVFVHADLGPCVVGIISPRIVVPAHLLPSADALAAVLAHERAHIARRDHIVAPVVQIACILAWPVLPIWVAARRFRTLAEIACDERALACETRLSRRRYAEVLMALAEERPRGLVPSFGGELRTRIAALSRGRRWHGGAQNTLVLAAAAAALACSGSASDTAGASSPASEPIAPPDELPLSLAYVQPGFASVQGAVDKQAIRQVATAHLGEVLSCYRGWLIRKPGLGGRITVAFSIGPNGRIYGWNVRESQLPGTHFVLEKCLGNAMSTWQFPKPTDGRSAQVVYPFLFSPWEPRGTAVPSFVAQLRDRKPLRSCFDAEVRDGALAATDTRKLFLAVIVKSDGTVADAKTEGEEFPPRFRNCVLAAIRSETMPTNGADGYQMSVPLVFGKSAP